MAIILLDEEFYKEEIFFKYKEYFKELLKLISKYFNLDIAIFLPNANINEIWSNNHLIAQINKEIQKTGHFEILNELDVIPKEDSDFKVLNFSETLIGEIQCLHDRFQHVIIPLSPDKHEKDKKQILDYVYIINHIYKELDSNISTWISTNMYMNNILAPTLQSPLPNISLCSEYKKLQDELIQGEDIHSRIPIFLKVGKEVLQRNTYIHNKTLSSINTTNEKIRDIYQKNDLSIYGSIDVESGSIEICDHNGHHEDEFGFDNQKHYKHDSTGKHDIKLHK